MSASPRPENDRRGKALWRFSHGQISREKLAEELEVNVADVMDLHQPFAAGCTCPVGADEQPDCPLHGDPGRLGRGTPRPEAGECPVRCAVRWFDLEVEALPDNVKRELPRHFWNALMDLGKAMTSPCVPAGPELSDAATIARVCVGFDGASEDGCIICGAGYHGDEPFLRHEPDCAVARYRLARIEVLVRDDPSKDSAEGRELVALAETQQKYERVMFPLVSGASPERGTAQPVDGHPACTCELTLGQDRHRQGCPMAKGGS